MNGNKRWMYQTEINFLTWKIVCNFETFENTDINIIFPIPFKVMCISLRYS